MLLITTNCDRNGFKMMVCVCALNTTLRIKYVGAEQFEA